MEHISIDDFHKLEARIGTVLTAEPIEGSDKLIKFSLDFGEPEPRQILSGIKQWYPNCDALIGKQVLFVINLLPRNMMGLESNGMLMAVDGEDGAPVFLIPEKKVLPGAKVR